MMVSFRHHSDNILAIWWDRRDAILRVFLFRCLRRCRRAHKLDQRQPCIRIIRRLNDRRPILRHPKRTRIRQTENPLAHTQGPPLYPNPYLTRRQNRRLHHTTLTQPPKTQHPCIVARQPMQPQENPCQDVSDTRSGIRGATPKEDGKGKCAERKWTCQLLMNAENNLIP